LDQNEWLSRFFVALKALHSSGRGSSESDGGDWLVKLFIGIVATAFGAAVTWWLKGNEAHDAELSRRLDDAVAELAQIERVSTEVWGTTDAAIREGDKAERQGDGRVISKISELEGRLHRLSGLIEFAGERVANFGAYETDTLLIQLRSACTNDGVASLDLPPIPFRVKTILVRATALVICLRSMQRDALPRSSWSRFRRPLRPLSKQFTRDSRNYWDL